MNKKKKIISQKKDKSLFSRSKNISEEIEKINKTQNGLKKEIEVIISSLPNIALDDVPVGKDAKSNKEINLIGEVPQFDFKPKKIIDRIKLKHTEAKEISSIL